jgi:hypothetical protein
MDTEQHRNAHVEAKQDSIVDKMERLEKVKAMRQLLESLVELSQKNEGSFTSENVEKKLPYHRMIGLLKTITELQEKYIRENGLTNEEADDLAESLVAG